MTSVFVVLVVVMVLVGCCGGGGCTGGFELEGREGVMDWIDGKWPVRFAVSLIVLWIVLVLGNVVRAALWF